MASDDPEFLKGRIIILTQKNEHLLQSQLLLQDEVERLKQSNASAQQEILFLRKQLEQTQNQNTNPEQQARAQQEIAELKVQVQEITTIKNQVALLQQQKSCKPVQQLLTEYDILASDCSTAEPHASDAQPEVLQSKIEKPPNISTHDEKGDTKICKGARLLQQLARGDRSVASSSPELVDTRQIDRSTKQANSVHASSTNKLLAQDLKTVAFVPRSVESSMFIMSDQQCPSKEKNTCTQCPQQSLSEDLQVVSSSSALPECVGTKQKAAAQLKRTIQKIDTAPVTKTMRSLTAQDSGTSSTESGKVLDTKQNFPKQAKLNNTIASTTSTTSYASTTKGNEYHQEFEEDFDTKSKPPESTNLWTRGDNLAREAHPEDESKLQYVEGRVASLDFEPTGGYFESKLKPENSLISNREASSSGVATRTQEESIPTQNASVSISKKKKSKKKRKQKKQQSTPSVDDNTVADDIDSFLDEAIASSKLDEIQLKKDKFKTYIDEIVQYGLVEVDDPITIEEGKVFADFMMKFGSCIIESGPKVCEEQEFDLQNVFDDDNVLRSAISKALTVKIPSEFNKNMFSLGLNDIGYRILHDYHSYAFLNAEIIARGRFELPKPKQGCGLHEWETIISAFQTTEAIWHYHPELQQFEAFCGRLWGSALSANLTQLSLIYFNRKNTGQKLIQKFNTFVEHGKAEFDNDFEKDVFLILKDIFLVGDPYLRASTPMPLSSFTM